MSDGLNRVQLLGNLGQDPELRFTQSGTAVLNMRLATTETYLDKGQNKKEQTDWHNVVMWGKRGEKLAEILSKGSRIFVEGSIRNSSFEGRDGQKKYKSEVNAKNIILCGGRAPGGEQTQGQGGYGSQSHAAPAQQQQQPSADAFGPGDDSIPF